MGLFNDLPAAVTKEGGSGPRFESEAELDAQLAKLKESGPPSSDEASECEGEGEDEDDEEEEAAPSVCTLVANQDLRRRPRSRDDEVHEHGMEPQQQQQEQRPEQPEQQQRKRVRIHEDVVTQAHEPPQQQPQGDEVGAALRRIAAHIGNPTKFAKACPLLRKLLDGEALTKAPHQADLFQAIRAAFTDPAACTEPLLKREYMKLVAAIASRPDLFGKAEKAHLDIYRLIGHVQNEMSTDDSFSFNKALGRVREAMEELGEATADDDAALASLSSRGQGNAWAAAGRAHEGDEQLYQEQLQRLEQEHAKHVKAWEEKQQRLDQQQQGQQSREEGEHADPFGLDTLMAMEAKPRRPAQRPAAPALPAPPAPTTAWDAVEAACMRREAVLQCLHSSRSFHKNAWARTGVELLIEQCYENKARFCASQQPVLEDLMTWVKQQRAKRKQGPSAKEINRDSTSFDRARADWSKVAVSHRGKVGGNGDSKANNWLG